jgi:aromatic ring-opening dioxygenase LigB subunit
LGIEEHLEFGRAVAAAVEASGRRTLFVASGDLSHRLTPGAPAGYDERGQQFDRQVADSFTRADWDSLVHLPPSLVEAAGILFGVLSGREHRTRLLSYEGPFGVGYLVGAVDVVSPPPEAQPV